MKRPIPVLLALLLLTPLLGGCHKVRARVEMKKGNEYYLNESYRQALSQYQKGLELDPSATFAWRSSRISGMPACFTSVKTVSQPVSTTGETPITSTPCAMNERMALI